MARELTLEELAKKRVRNLRQMKARRHLHGRARNSARINRVPFELDVEDLILPTHCPVLGIKLEFTENNRSDCFPTVDRVIPEKGYVRGNV